MFRVGWQGLDYTNWCITNNAECEDDEGGSKAPKPTAQDLANMVPQTAKDAIEASVEASNSKNGSDPEGGHHEEGGVWGPTRDDTELAVPAKPGAYCHLDKCQQASVQNLDSADPSKMAKLKNIEGQWHVHPKGTRDFLDRHAEFNQGPSGTKGNPGHDIKTGIFKINIVIGARDGKVYFYDTTGVVAKMKYTDFIGKE